MIGAVRASSFSSRMVARCRASAMTTRPSVIISCASLKATVARSVSASVMVLMVLADAASRCAWLSPPPITTGIGFIGLRTGKLALSGYMGTAASAWSMP